jgi:hypothetical protein
VLRRYPERRARPKLVYISHNHEESLRAQLAADVKNMLKRQVMRLDALKTTLNERALVGAADLVSAITPEDGALYRKQYPEKPIVVLTPGYRGRFVAGRRITEKMPRRAVIVGSFDWIAKRMNLEEFVAAADRTFSRYGVELQVIGSGDERFFNELRGRVAATKFTGTVECVNRYLDEARVAIVPERNGGGFKLKVLEYVFNRVPILAITGSTPGVPLRDGDSILQFGSQHELARGVMRTIDDIDGLNRLQDRAFAACRDHFDWTARGTQLAAAVGAL